MNILKRKSAVLGVSLIFVITAFIAAMPSVVSAADMSREQIVSELLSKAQELRERIAEKNNTVVAESGSATVIVPTGILTTRQKALNALRTRIAAVQERIAVEQQVATENIRNTGNEALEDIREQIASVQEKIAGKQKQVSETTREVVADGESERKNTLAAIREQIASVQEKIAGKQKQVSETTREVVADGESERKNTLAAIREQIASVQEKIAGKQTVVAGTQKRATVSGNVQTDQAREKALESFRKRVAALQKRIAEKRAEVASDGQGTQTGRTVTETIRERISSVQERIIEKKKTVVPDSSASITRTPAATAGIAAGTSGAGATSQPSIDDIKKRMTEVTIQLTDPNLSATERDTLTQTLINLSNQLSAATAE